MMRDICRNDDARQLRIEVYESNRKGKFSIQGTIELTIKEIAIDNKKHFTAFNKKMVVGELIILKCQFLNRYTFLDYIHGGCDVSLMLAMDFTLSNKSPKDPQSLHYISPELFEKRRHMAVSPGRSPGAVSSPGRG